MDHLPHGARGTAWRPTRRQVKELVDAGCEAIYLWGVRANRWCAGRIDLVAKAVEVAKNLGVPSGVGGHDLRVVEQCETAQGAGRFLHQDLPSSRLSGAPKPEQLGPDRRNARLLVPGPEGDVDS